jgi:hypothetical protein
MNIKKKIGWQKYEDVIEEQLDSPLLDMLYQKMGMVDLDDEDEDFVEDEDDQPTTHQNLMILIDSKLIENISLTQNFDCWLGHTNFNITKEIKDKLNRTEGIELLKICSRYRFFIGVGRMFDFGNVRKVIEDLFLE